MAKSLKPKTSTPKPFPKEYEVDAQGKRLGRVASDIAMMLQGKRAPDYAPNQVGARVVVKNLKQLDLVPKKMNEKIYYRHTGYMGHLRKFTLGQKWEKSPEEVLREAVRRMLPKNFLNAQRLKNLIIVK